ncbi:MAG TPA: hypothetical protein VE011_00560 [Candidatus Dormibacteraeota bacterium]|nr:hypothetical protein [Candidatus Dormibacteraeota bacterium]
MTTLETAIAVRAYVSRTRPNHVPEPATAADLVLIIDTETRTDAGQSLTFGSYRVVSHGRCTQEGLFYADELAEADRAVLERYAADHAAANGGWLRLRSRSAFMEEVFWPIAYKAQGLVLGFNLPFDLSRLATSWRRARRGGFSLGFFEWTDKDGAVRRNQFRPEITIKALDSRRNFIRFTALTRTDSEHKEGKRWYRGRFLDLRTFVYALTDEKHSLESAGRAFGATARKGKATEHGRVTEEYISYNREDVAATWALYEALLVEWRRHPIDIGPEQAYSPAAVSKAYLRLAGVTPPAERSAVSVPRLGQATTAYYGGRAGTQIRAVPLPVRYLDYTSMYPTVFALLGLWDLVTAERLEAIDATDVARAFLARADRASLHSPESWPELAGVFARIRPAGDLVPVRAQYGLVADGVGSPAWTIGLNELEADDDLWYPLADLVAGKILGGPVSEILEAFRVVPVGRLASLEPVRLRGSVRVDPARDDLFRRSIEERVRIRADQRLVAPERERVGQFLKTFATGGAYGIFAEFRQLDPKAGGTRVEADGLWHLRAHVETAEEPGAFCFPPLAATITGGARLLLALAQADVEARGGTYVAYDTDSLIVVASETGGFIACPEGIERLPDGRAAVRALSYAEVEQLRGELNALNPYRRGAVSSMLKLEDQNFALLGYDEDHNAIVDRARPAELWAFAQSSKRYVLYNRGEDGAVEIRKPSEHGLGLLRAPVDPPTDWNRPWRYWVEVVWRRRIAEAEGRDPGPEPAWFERPAVSQLPVSSPAVLSAFRGMNAALPFADQVKPFGFLMMGHVDALASPQTGADERVTPVAPYNNNPAELLSLEWRDRRTGKPIKVTTKPGGRPGYVRLKTYGDFVRELAAHPEYKSGHPGGGLGRRSSVGVLPRLRVKAVGLPVHIGKESNRLDEFADGLVHDAEDVYVVYRDERREWEAALAPLRRLRDTKGWWHLAEASGLSERALRYAMNGGKMPHERARRALLALLGRPRGE